MSVASNGFTLSTTAYTAVATTAVGRVRLVTDNNKYAARVVVAPVIPDADSDDWFPLQPGSILTMEGLDGFTVWVRANAEPSGASITQKVRVLIDSPLHEVVVKPLF